MQTTLICPACGKTIAIELFGPSESPQTCPECCQPVDIPEGIATLPTPQIPESSAPERTAALQAGPEEAYADEGSPDEDAQDTPEHVSARALPWLVSTTIHAAIALLLTVLVAVTLQSETDAETFIPPNVGPDAEMPKIFEELIAECDSDATEVKPTDKRFTDEPQGDVIGDGVEGEENPNVYGVAGLAGDGEPGLGDGTGVGSGPRGRRVFNNEADCVVYVIDRSGSMHGTFDDIEYELRRSISSLRYDPAEGVKQQFYVVLFADGGAIELSGRKMMNATDENKIKILNALEEIEPQGKTDPIPALKRAFGALRGVGRDKICSIELLTDGSFPDNAAALEAIDEFNDSRRVRINTVLYGSRPREAEDVLTQIAERNGGRYKYVSPDEF